MPSNEGYINVTAIMQKFLTKQSVETGHTIQKNYPDNKVLVSVMANDLLTTYKYGWKTSYYQNTYDNKKDVDADAAKTEQLINEILHGTESEEDCDSCKV